METSSYDSAKKNGDFSYYGIASLQGGQVGGVEVFRFLLISPI
jgi:hypothetical protein